MVKREDFTPLRPWILLGFVFTVMILFVVKFDFVIAIFSRFLSTLTPLFYALGFAFVLNIFASRLEKLLAKINEKSLFLQKIRRPLAIFISVIIMFLILFFLFYNIIPQLINSILALVTNLPNYLVSLQDLINSFLTSMDIPYKLDISNTQLWIDALPQMTNFVSLNLGSFLNKLLSFTGVFMDMFLGFMVSFYFLFDKETFLRQAKKIVMGLFPNNYGIRLLQIGKQANQTYTNFITVQLVESILLGIIFYLLLTILKMPYILLISCMIALFSVVPVAGSIAAWIISTLVILAIEPTQALIFMILFQVITQFLSSVVYPRIVGKRIGLPGVWTLLAVFIGGGLFGINGILLGVPSAAVLYALFVEFINNRLTQNKIKISDEIEKGD